MSDPTGSAPPLTDKAAIVTGSGRGIGAAIALHLARLGAGVVVNYLHDEASARTVAKQIEAAGGRAVVVGADAGTPEGTQALADAAREELGGVDVLVSSAGPLFRPIPLTEMTWEDFGGLVGKDLASAFHATQAVLPTMIEQHWGRIVFIGSASAHHPSPGMAHHGSSRAALASFSAYVSREMAPHGITANTVSPGMVRTDRTAAAADAIARMGRMTPRGRVAEPEDVARAVGIFAADAEGFFTGTDFPVDGGLTAG